MHKNFIKPLVLILLITSTLDIFAITPKNNWYAGIFLGPSSTAASSFDFGKPITFETANVSLSASSGRITYSVLGGIGGQIGYRFCDKHRIEGEFYYNNNHIKQLQLYDYSMTNKYDPAANEPYVALKVFNNLENTSDAHIQGDINTGAFMLNFIYDLLTTSPNSDGYNKVVPFVGAGIGYAYVQNALQIYRATTADPANDPYTNRQIFDALQKKYIYAGQALVGINYFMDDFTWCGIDVRYFTTGSSLARTQYTYITPYTTYTTSSNSAIFSNKTQILSANISISGSLNL